LDAEVLMGERLYWDFAPEEERNEHLDRYNFALELFQHEWVCLDAACGSGYGSAVIAKKVSVVYGLDISEHAVRYARQRYTLPNVHFQRADLERPLPLGDESVDAITSFETLEHVHQQRAVLSEFRRILKPGGILVISTPDREVLAHVSGNNNFHVAELSKVEFVSLLGEAFKVKALYGHSQYQPVKPHWRLVHACLRLLSRLDTLHLRDRIICKHSLHARVNTLRRRFWPMQSTTLQPIPLDGSGPQYAYLVAVVTKAY
jgi:SAM-dependent methyltransferase